MSVTTDLGRGFRIDLRRSAAPSVGLLVFALGVAGMYLLSDGSWAGRWTPTALSLRLYVSFLWPATFAGGAWLGGRDRRGDVAELFTGTARPVWQRLASPAAALTASVAAGYLLVVAACLPRVAGRDAYLHPAVLGVAGVGLLALVAAGLLGMAAGRALPSRLGAPGCAVLGLVYVVSASVVNVVSDERVQSVVTLLTPHLNAYAMDVIIVPPRFSAGQALWFAGLGAAGWLLLVARTRRLRAAALLPPLLAAAVAVPLMPRTDGPIAAYASDPGALALVCTPDLPRVCVRRVHAAFLPEVVPIGRRALHRLSVLPDPPATVVEGIEHDGSRLNTERPGPDVVRFYASMDRHLRITAPGHLELELLEGAGAPVCPGRRTEDYPARRAVAYWLAGQAPPAEPEWDGDRAAADAWRALTALAPDEQRRRVAELRRAALRCTPDLTAVLTGP